MSESNKINQPIFIGGTGRCGTSIMAKYLSQDPLHFLPCHENKLIVEQDGLMDILDAFSSYDDHMRRHFAISRFIDWSRKLRDLGSVDREANLYLQTLTKSMSFHKSVEKVYRELPKTQINIHSIAGGFGQAHYDYVVSNLVKNLIVHKSESGIVDSAGFLKPFFISKKLSRPEVLKKLRAFLVELYSVGGDVHWIDDTPSNSKHANFLFELFPNAKFIHMVRNPLDVADSTLKQVWSMHRTPDEALIEIQNHHQNFEDFCSTFPDFQVLTIKLEEMVFHHEQQRNRLEQFLGYRLNVPGALFDENEANIGRSVLDKGILLNKKFKILRDWMDIHGY